MDLISGIYQRAQNKPGFLRDPKNSFRPGPTDIFVPPPLSKEYKLANGARVIGTVKTGDKGMVLETIESICDVSPQEYKDRTSYKYLTAIDPCRRFNLAVSDKFNMRATGAQKS